MKPPTFTRGRALTGMLSLVAALLAACSTAPEVSVAWEGDGAPLVALAAGDVADAVPRPDPILKAGNTSPYRVDGIEYHVLPTALGYRETGIASWYGTKFHGNKTANGEMYDLSLATAAHRSLPLPSYVRVTHLKNRRSVVVRVNDRGPFHASRLIDLSYGAAVKLGFVEDGTARVQVEAIALAGVDDRRDSEEGEYRYLQLGAFASVHAAESLRDAVDALVTIPVTLSPVDIGGARLKRVRVGPVADGRELRQLRNLLMSRGYSPGIALP